VASLARTRLSAAERSDLIADQIAVALERRPANMTIRDALETLAQRAIQVRDDLHRRNVNAKTWETMRKVKDGHGNVTTLLPYSDDQRRKMVASTIGSMLVAHHRQTRDWVLDAVDEAIGYLPWKVRS
jgi:hypothetical protein